MRDIMLFKVHLGNMGTVMVTMGMSRVQYTQRTTGNSSYVLYMQMNALFKESYPIHVHGSGQTVVNSEQEHSFLLGWKYMYVLQN